MYSNIAFHFFCVSKQITPTLVKENKNDEQHDDRIDDAPLSRYPQESKTTDLSFLVSTSRQDESKI